MICKEFVRFLSVRTPLLYSVQDELFKVDVNQVVGRNLRQGVTARLLFYHCAGARCQYLTSKSGVVDLHCELETLVLSLAADALTFEQNAVTHIAQIFYARYLMYVGVVVAEIRI